MSQDTVFAITSLSPAPDRVDLTRDCIHSWRNAGLKVRAFNHPSEIPELMKFYDIEIVPVSETSAAVFGKHFVPIKTMLDWAAEQDAPALLINSDILLDFSDWEFKRIRWLSDGGMCYFVRHNHDGDRKYAHREPYGIDGFLLHGRDAACFPDSFLSMGQPFWDYWIPHTLAAHRRRIYTMDSRRVYHRNHAMRWSWQNWHRCALEFARVTSELKSDESFEACVEMSVRVRERFDRERIAISPTPPDIVQWVQQKFSYHGPKVFLELGAHQGTDTAWMARISDVAIHAFEPDPRNHPPPLSNVVHHRQAISDCDGSSSLILSKLGWGQEWTHSSSIKRPKNHLSRYPVTFGESVDIEAITLDTFCRREGLDLIDFIWADIQGAEGEMIRGGVKTLARTRYLYTEYSDDELYEKQATLKDILQMLPDYRVVELWPDDVLLENQALK